MFNPGCEVFIEIPGEGSERILHPGCVLLAVSDPACEQSMMTIECRGKALNVQPGQEILLYFEQNDHFMRQPAKISMKPSCDPVEPNQLFVELVKSAASAESRKSRRFDIKDWDLRMQFGVDTDCVLIDIGEAGCALVAKHEYDVNKLVPSAMHYKEGRYEGLLSVKSLRKLPGSKGYRYGVQYVPVNGQAGNIHRVLRLINLDAQRAEAEGQSEAA